MQSLTRSPFLSFLSLLLLLPLSLLQTEGMTTGWSSMRSKGKERERRWAVCVWTAVHRSCVFWKEWHVDCVLCTMTHTYNTLQYDLILSQRTSYHSTLYSMISDCLRGLVTIQYDIRLSQRTSYHSTLYSMISDCLRGLVTIQYDIGLSQRTSYHSVWYRTVSED